PDLLVELGAVPLGGRLPALFADVAVEISAVLALGGAPTFLADLFVKTFAVALADDGTALLAGFADRHLPLLFCHGLSLLKLGALRVRLIAFFGRKSAGSRRCRRFIVVYCAIRRMSTKRARRRAPYRQWAGERPL